MAQTASKWLLVAAQRRQLLEAVKVAEQSYELDTNMLYHETSGLSVERQPSHKRPLTALIYAKEDRSCKPDRGGAY